MGLTSKGRLTEQARELLEACLVNPYDVEGTADVLAQSLSLPATERAEAMQRMMERISNYDVYEWARKLFRSLDELARREEARRFPGN